MSRGIRIRRSAAIIGTLAAALSFGACAKDIATQAPPSAEDSVSALFDPALSILPKPTDLAKNQVTGLLAVPVADETVNPAQAAFDRYLNTLDGFPGASTVTACFAAEIDPASLTDNVKVLELPATATDQPTPVTDVTAGAPTKSLACPVLTATSCNVKDLTGCTAEQVCVRTSTATASCADAGYLVAFAKATPWKAGARYAFYVTNGVKTKAGKPIIRSRSFELAAAENPLCEFNATELKCTYNYSTLLASQVKATLTAENDAKRAAGDATALSPEDLEAAIRDAVLSSATQFELLRQAHNAVLAAAPAAGLNNRDDIVLAWFFSISSMVEAVFDPSNGKIPGPGNDLLYDATAGKVNIPAQPGESATDKALREGLNTLDGFSTTGTYFAPFSGKLDATRIKNAADAIDLIVVNTADPTDVVAASFSWSDNANAILFKPLVPLKEKTRYAVLLRSRGNAEPKDANEAVAAVGGLADATGRRVVASSVFALARLEDSLVDSEGKSTISVLDDASANALEAVRAAYNPLLTGLEANPAIVPAFKREDVVIGWTFVTQTITEPLTKLRALPYQILATVDSNTPKFTGGIDPTLASWPAAAPKDKVGGLGAGTFKTWIALDPTTGAFLPDPTKGTAVDVPFYVSLPKMADCSTAACADTTATCAELMNGTTGTGIKYCVPAKLPVVVFQHGITRAKTDFFAVANALNGAGYAVLAFDINYHGERSICLSNADCVATASCSTDKKCCDQTTSTDCKTSYFLDANTDGVPDVSGGPAFLNTSNPFAIRDNLRQHIIDVSAFLRAISLGAASGLQWPLATATGMAPIPGFDKTNINWASQSLGSILGTLVMATDSTVKRAVLNVPGGPLVGVFDGTNNPSFIAIVDGMLDARGLCKDEGGKKVCPHDTLGALQLFHTLQWIVDPGDAANFAKYVKTESLKDEVASAVAGSDVMVTKKEVIVQVAGKDNVIPTQLEKDLAGWMGVDITDTTYDTEDHGFLLAPSPNLAATGAAQTQMVKFLLLGSVCKPDTTTGQCN